MSIHAFTQPPQNDSPGLEQEGVLHALGLLQLPEVATQPTPAGCPHAPLEHEQGRDTLETQTGVLPVHLLQGVATQVPSDPTQGSEFEQVTVGSFEQVPTEGSDGQFWLQPGGLHSVVTDEQHCTDPEHAKTLDEKKKKEIVKMIQLMKVFIKKVFFIFSIE